jgi:hypothetical protein
VVGRTRLGRLTLLALLSVVGVLALAPSANAGRLIQSGHDIEWHCEIPASHPQCRFVRVALNYVRAGAPDPSKPVLVLDRPGVNGTLVPEAIRRAYGVGGAQCPDSGVGTMCTVVDPRTAFATTPNVNTANYSAIWVASDQSCGGCDLNDPYTPGPPHQADTPDSTAIASRTDDIAAFYNAGGGIIAGAGADNATGRVGNPFDPNFGDPIAFSSPNVPYYSFLATSGATNATSPFSLTSLGTGMGLTASDVCNGCGTHNSFGPPPAGSQLKSAERDSAGRIVTLIQDTDPPTASIASGPTPVSTTRAANRRFTFASNEKERPAFQCRVDNAPFVACGSPWTAANLSDGRHTIDIRAIDLVGNVQPTPTSATFCVPGTSEVTGNRVDEDCNGFSAPFQEIDATIRFSFRFTRRTTQVTLMNLARVTRRATLRVRCRGRGCPFRSRRVRLRRNRARLARIFRRRGRRASLRPGARISLSLTRRGFTSKVYRFRVRRAVIPPFGTFCQLPGSRRLRRSCPSFR